MPSVRKTVYVLAASDFQGTYSSAHDTAGVVSTMKQIMAKTGRTSFDSFMFMGDYNLGSDDQTVNGLNTLKSALSGYSFNQQFFLQGNHDPAPATGGYDRYLGGSTNFVSSGESLWIADTAPTTDSANATDSLNSDQINGIVFIDGIKDVGNNGDPNAPKPSCGIPIATLRSSMAIPSP